MKIIFFILAASLALTLAEPGPEAEAEADPQYDLSEAFMDPYGELDEYPVEDVDVELRSRLRRYCCRFPRTHMCRRLRWRLICPRLSWGK